MLINRKNIQDGIIITTYRMLTHSGKRSENATKMLDVIENLGFDVIKVDITEIDDHAYKSSIHLVAKDDASHLKVIDARPSDAIALAVRIGVPIFANQELAITDFEIRDEKEEAQDKEDFKNFVQNLKASDFKLDGFEPNVD